jgi:hypothetical protein
MKPEKHAHKAEIRCSHKTPLPSELRTAINTFLKGYDRYVALNKAKTVGTTQRQKELTYIKLLRAYLSLLRRL